MPLNTRNISRERKQSPRRTNVYRKAEKLSPAKTLAAFLGFWAKAGLTIAFIALASVVLLYAYRYVSVQPFFAVDEIVVTGNVHRSDTALAELAGINQGRNIFEVNIGQAQERLSRDPWIASVSVRRILPGRLEIHVRERQACFWIIRDQELFYADRRGKVIDRVEPAHFFSLPVLKGGDPPRMGDLLSRMVEFLQTNRLPFGSASVESISISPDGLLEIFLDHPPVQISLGTGDLETNCRRLALVWDDLEKRQERIIGLQAIAGKVWAKRG